MVREERMEAILTDAGLDVDVVTPLTVPQTSDQSLVEASAREAPAFSSEKRNSILTSLVQKSHLQKYLIAVA